MGFWVAATVVALLAVFALAKPLAFGRRASRSRAAHDAQVFKDQLAEIGRDIERGVLSPDEAEAARIEVSRRLLAADAERARSSDHQPAPLWASYALAICLLAGAPIGVLALYAGIGAPGLPDQPAFAGTAGPRPSQDVAEQQIARHGEPSPPPQAGAEQFNDMIAQLETRLAETDQPDPRGLFLLARSYARMDRHAEAWRAFDRLAVLEGDRAPAELFVAKGESMILAARGYVSPEAEGALEQALIREPGNPIARYYKGVAQAQTGRPGSAIETWSSLIGDSPVGAPWLASTRARIDELVQSAGLTPPALPSPREPTAQERLAAMAATVARLEARLLSEGGETGDWLSLVKSLRALGEDARAADAEAAAREALAGDPAQLALFEKALAAPDSAIADGGASDPAAVASLATRLDDEGGAPEEWLQLVASYGALGDQDAARDAAARARDALADDPAALAAFEAALPRGAAPGPTADQVAAASEMSEQDRAQMIQGMVNGLRERLFEDGGAPEEWARLIRALGVIGDVDGATEAWRRAIEEHGEDAVAVSGLTEFAAVAGVDVTQ